MAAQIDTDSTKAISPFSALVRAVLYVGILASFMTLSMGNVSHFCWVKSGVRYTWGHIYLAPRLLKLQVMPVKNISEAEDKKEAMQMMSTWPYAAGFSRIVFSIML